MSGDPTMQEPPMPIWSIAAVERDTGLSKETLRMWERRYGFPTPHRESTGERAYPLEQLERLRAIKRLLDAGHRPGRVVALPRPALLQMLGEVGAARPVPAQPPEHAVAPAHPGMDACYRHLRDHDLEGVRHGLSEALTRLGLARFVSEWLVPMNTRVGNAWMRGELAVFEEHAYTELVTVLLRQALGRLQSVHAQQRPAVLLTTLPGEPHGLGLLMVEALLAMEGCRCVSLGVQTPVPDVVAATQAFGIDIVALSFTGCQKPAQVQRGLQQLREALPPAVQVWAGGAAMATARRRTPGVPAFTSLDEVLPALRAWRDELSPPE